MRVAAIQMQSGDDPGRNQDEAANQVRVAAERGAELVVLPEKWPFLGPSHDTAAAAQPLTGPALTAAGDWARTHGVWIAAGSIAERDSDGGPPYNCCALIDPDGAITATYRKLHMFDVDLPGGASHRESDHERPGERVVVADGPGLRIGFAICYDLRFPELFRALALAGAELVVVPSAFTAVTGRAHWETLIRARAIENGMYVVAANQWGSAPGGLNSHGHSLIADPWGEIVAELPAGAGVADAEVDPGRVAEVRAAIPVLDHLRPRAYRSL